MRKSDQNNIQIQEIRAIDTMLDLAIQMARTADSKDLEKALDMAKRISEENLAQAHRYESSMNALMI